MKVTAYTVASLGGIAVVGMVLDGAGLTDFQRHVPIDQAPIAIPSSAPSISMVLNNVTGEEIPLPPVDPKPIIGFPST